MYYLYVDTENYSGNFEREMTAFSTGLLAEGGMVGEELAEEAQQKMKHHSWWAKNVILQANEDYPGYLFPVTMAATPGWYNDGYGGEHRADSEEAAQHTNKYPSYQSILITTKTSPPQEVWEEFQERLIEFCEDNDLTLTGVRREEQNTSKFKM